MNRLVSEDFKGCHGKKNRHPNHSLPSNTKIHYLRNKKNCLASMTLLVLLFLSSFVFLSLLFPHPLSRVSLGCLSRRRELLVNKCPGLGRLAGIPKFSLEMTSQAA